MAASLTTIDDLSGSLTGRSLHAERTVPTREQDLLVGLPPRWLAEVAAQIVSLVNLEPGWDSYGARRVSTSMALDALELLHQLVGLGLPAPQVVPTSRGGVQFEWDAAGVELEIELQPDGRMLAIFDDGIGEGWDRELPPNDLAPLADAFRTVARAGHGR